MTKQPASLDMVEGYIDGMRDHRLEFPDSLSNRGAAYRHGWLNGRDDRIRNPRAGAVELRRAADEAMDSDRLP